MGILSDDSELPLHRNSSYPDVIIGNQLTSLTKITFDATVKSGSFTVTDRDAHCVDESFDFAEILANLRGVICTVHKLSDNNARHPILQLV